MTYSLPIRTSIYVIIPTPGDCRGLLVEILRSHARDKYDGDRNTVILCLRILPFSSLIHSIESEKQIGRTVVRWRLHLAFYGDSGVIYKSCGRWRYRHMLQATFTSRFCLNLMLDTLECQCSCSFTSSLDLSAWEESPE